MAISHLDLRVRLLDRIYEPSDLRGLTVAQLHVLAGEIRDHLVTSVAAVGGHLGSNLGAVELTLALHRTFDTPCDALIWDTGHQTYVHKMITGRQGAFDGLRQKGGLSGYPSRSESPHDLIENSHASVALGYAFGLARARHDSDTPGAVIAVVGDGALTGGVAYEALNNIGWSRLPVIVVVNDNGRSYAPTVSRLCGPDGRARRFFDALGLAYIGPVDGHDLHDLDAAFALARESTGPIVVHVMTQKGRGFEPAESDPVKCMHDTAPFDPNDGTALRPRSETFTDVFGTSIVGLAEQRNDIYAITAAMPCSTGLSQFAARFPDRFIDVGIAEQQAVTAAAGLAMGGARPIVALYSTFLNRAWDQVYHDVGLHGLPVVFCIDRAGITGDDGASHNGVLDMALLTKVPGMTVLAPSSSEELESMLYEAISRDGPVALRWPKGIAPRSGTAQVGTGLHARRLRHGHDVCLLAVGKLVTTAVEAAKALAERDVKASVWDVRSVQPLDPKMLLAAVNHRSIITLEDGVAEGGVGARIASAVAELEPNPPPVRVLGIPTRFLPHGRQAELLTELGLDAAGVTRTVAEVFAHRSAHRNVDVG